MQFWVNSENKMYVCNILLQEYAPIGGKAHQYRILLPGLLELLLIESVSAMSQQSSRKEM